MFNFGFSETALEDDFVFEDRDGLLSEDVLKEDLDSPFGDSKKDEDDLDSLPL